MEANPREALLMSFRGKVSRVNIDLMGGENCERKQTTKTGNTSQTEPRNKVCNFVINFKIQASDIMVSEAPWHLIQTKAELVD
jgi:hypothetical protein